MARPKTMINGWAYVLRFGKRAIVSDVYHTEIEARAAGLNAKDKMAVLERECSVETKPTTGYPVGYKPRPK